VTPGVNGLNNILPKIKYENNNVFEERFIMRVICTLIYSSHTKIQNYMGMTSQSPTDS
jgi:hypothetical protein